MDNPTPRSLVPLGLLFSIAILLTVAGFVYGLPTGRPAALAAVACIVLSAALLFLIGRGVLHPFWGLVMGVLLLLHPVYQDYAAQPGAAFQAEVLTLLGFGCVLGLWHRAFATDFRPVPSAALAAGAILAGAAAWFTNAQAALTLTVFPLAALLPASVLALRCRTAVSSRNPAKVNAACVALAGVAIPVAALLVAPALWQAVVALDRNDAIDPEVIAHRSLEGQSSPVALLRHGVVPGDGASPLSAFSAANLGEWTWPHQWTVLTFVAVGLWLTIWNGRGRYRDRRAPLAWGVLLFVLVSAGTSFLNPQSALDRGLVHLATLAVLLGIFGLGDGIHAVGRRMILAPPDDEENREIAARVWATKADEN